MYHIVYANHPGDTKDKQEEVKKIYDEILTQEPEYTLDAIMLLSGSESKSIRSVAFSTLSNLSTHSSKYKSVMAQILRDC